MSGNPTFPNLRRACGGEIRLEKLVQIKAALARQPQEVQREFLEFMRLARDMFVPVEDNATYVYLIIRTDEEGDVAVEVFDTFDGAKAYILDGIMDANRRERRTVTAWIEDSLPAKVPDHDGDIILRKERVHSASPQAKQGTDTPVGREPEPPSCR
jgi:hypothetical protein